MAVLVTGGAGYIGSHAVAALLERGEEIVVVDNLQQGHQEALLGGKLYVGDLRDAAIFWIRYFKKTKSMRSFILQRIHWSARA